MKLRMGVICALFVTAGLVAGADADEMETVTIATHPVAPGIHMLVGRGGNIAVISGEGGVLLIDDQYAPLTEKIRAAVKAIDPAPIRFVVNTHWHGDHTGGNENLGAGGTVIVAHENVRTRMSTKQVMTAFDRKVPASPAGALPVLTFPDSVRFHVGGMAIRVEHVENAHTDGDSVVWFEDRKVVHMGDTYFNGFYPFIDIDAGGSITGVIAAADLALSSLPADAKVIPGHGPLSNPAELRAYRDMLAAVRERVKNAIGAGKSEDEVVALAPSAEFDASWGGGSLNPELFIRIAYRDLSRDEAKASPRQAR